MRPPGQCTEQRQHQDHNQYSPEHGSLHFLWDAALNRYIPALTGATRPIRLSIAPKLDWNAG
jgi:hypothetical protein